MPSKYEFTFDPDDTNTSHGLVAAAVPSGSRVLDVGCATGWLGEALAEERCVVHGIELDPEAAEIARGRLASVVVGDAQTFAYAEHFGADAFDVVVLADVLEHCTAPEQVLEGVLSVLSPGGRVIVSVPNVAHGSVRLALLQGRWRYTPLGLLDQTHLRFLTWVTLQELLTRAGLLVEAAWGTTADPLATEVDVDAAELPEGVADWVRAQPLATAYQFVLVARPASHGEVGVVEPVLAGRPDVPPTSPTLASAREEVDRLLSTIDDRDAELRAARAAATYHEVASLEAQRAVRASATWRVGSAVLAPVRVVTHALRKLPRRRR